MNKNFRKKTVNGVNARLDAIVKKYGFAPFDYLARKYIEGVKKKAKLRDEINIKERELEKLRDKA